MKKLFAILTLSFFYCLHGQPDKDIKHQLIMSSRQPWHFVKELNDSVVQVFSQIAEIDLLQPYKTPGQFAARGSGFFMRYKNETVIVTNAHVIDQAIVIWIRIPSLGKRFFNVEVIGVCPERDLALLRLQAEDAEHITDELGDISYLLLGNSDFVHRADEVLALGYPLGQESLKSTTGVISGREKNYIQMSAPINPGNSGGPLLNIHGEVVGINSSGIVEAQNVGYVIPINELKTILPDLYRIKLLRKPFLGILSVNATESLTSYLDNPQPGGCYVIEVIKNTPLYKAGVQPGDMIYEIDGNRLDIYGDMHVDWSEDKISIVDYVSRLAIGDQLNILLYRDGKPINLTVTFDHSEVLPIRVIYPGIESIDYEVFAGMVVMELTLNHIDILANHVPGLGRYTEINNQTDPILIVTHIFPTSELYRTRTLMPGITLKEINGQKVQTLGDFRKAIKSCVKGKYLTIRAADNVTRSSDNILVVLPYLKVVNEVFSLARDYHFPISDTVKEIVSNTTGKN